jgi:hypothetical protein
MFDGSGYPKNQVQMFEYLSVLLRYRQQSCTATLSNTQKDGIHQPPRIRNQEFVRTFSERDSFMKPDMPAS